MREDTLPGELPALRPPRSSAARRPRADPEAAQVVGQCRAPGRRRVRHEPQPVAVFAQLPDGLGRPRIGSPETCRTPSTSRRIAATSKSNCGQRAAEGDRRRLRSGSRDAGSGGASARCPGGSRSRGGRGPRPSPTRSGRASGTGDAAPAPAATDAGHLVPAHAWPRRLLEEQRVTDDLVAGDCEEPGVRAGGGRGARLAAAPVLEAPDDVRLGRGCRRWPPPRPRRGRGAGRDARRGSGSRPRSVDRPAPASRLRAAVSRPTRATSSKPRPACEREPVRVGLATTASSCVVPRRVRAPRL